MHQPRHFEQAFKLLFAKELSGAAEGSLDMQQHDAWAVKQFWRAGRGRSHIKHQPSPEQQSRYRSDFQVCKQIPLLQGSTCPHLQACTQAA